LTGLGSELANGPRSKKFLNAANTPWSSISFATSAYMP